MLNDLPKQLLSKDKKLNAQIEHAHVQQKKRSYFNRLLGLMGKAQPGFLEAEEGQQTLKLKQRELANLVNIQTASYQFSLDLQFGDYQAEYTRNGRTLLLTSNQGHVSLMDWRNKDLVLELHLKEKIRAGKFLHSDELFALAQQKHLFVYDKQGTEIHKLGYSQGIEYLPYHFLMASYCSRKLIYYDISTGAIVAEHPTKQPYTVIKQNPQNAVIALGTAKGTVEWWTPGSGRPAIQLFTGAGVVGIGFHKNYMVTASENIKVWDSRMLKVVNTYHTHRKVSGIELSATGILAVNYSYELQFFKDACEIHQSRPYMKYQQDTHNIKNARFVPFEDVMGLGLSKGFSSIIVPGSGDPNYDTFENNPFESKKQQRESLVHKLLDKLPPETITVDPNLIGTVDQASPQVIAKQQKEAAQKLEAEKQSKKKRANKMKGRNTVVNRINNKIRAREAERRRQISEIMNMRILARRAEKAKKKTELSRLEQLEEEGFDPLKVIRKKIVKAN